jgi:hypothetical protein
MADRVRVGDAPSEGLLRGEIEGHEWKDCRTTATNARRDRKWTGPASFRHEANDWSTVAVEGGTMANKAKVRSVAECPDVCYPATGGFCANNSGFHSFKSGAAAQPE